MHTGIQKQISKVFINTKSFNDILSNNTFQQNTFENLKITVYNFIF